MMLRNLTTGLAKSFNQINITTRRVIQMTFNTKQNAGLLKSARNWGALGLILALAVMVMTSQSLTLAHHGQNHGIFTASDECIGGANGFTLKNPPSHPASIRLHDKMFIVLNQSFQPVYQPAVQPATGPLVLIPPAAQRTWTWNQKTNNVQQPVGTYTVVLAVQDDHWDPFVSPLPDPALYVATFKILPPGPTC
jgi:hypothetical protein